MNPETPRADPGSEVLVGSVFANRYRILAKLGEGAMGDVYMGEHLTIGRRDAIKVLRPALAQDAEAIARFTRGTRNVSAIRHPNVCTIYDFSDTAEGVRFLAMEYVEGATLKERLDSHGPLGAAAAVEIAAQVADALQAAHDAGVVHRDLKPGNIMLCGAPGGTVSVKVVDFDIAKGPDEAEGEELTRVGFVIGTPEYMSPEQLTGDRLDGRSDVYSLGVVLFRMLTGSLPFRAAGAQEIMIQRLTEAPLRLSDLIPGAAPALDQAINKSLSRNREDRQQNAQAFAREITAALGAAAGAPAEWNAAAAQPHVPSEVPATRLERARPRTAAPSAGRRAGPFAIAAAAILLVGGAAAALLLTNSGNNAPSTPILLSGGDSGTGGGGMPPGTAGGGAADPSRAGVAQRDPTQGATTGRGLAATPPGDSGSRSATVFPADISAVLDRQLKVLSAEPSAAALRAVRDSASRAWTLAKTRADSGTAALVLAQAALAAHDDAACALWAQRGVALGAAGFDMLLQVCR
jgi:serine/threonine-protein kinase